MRLTSLDCSYHPLHHGTSQAQRIEVGQPLDSRGPRVHAIDSEGPRIVLADGAVYVWTPVGWGRVHADVTFFDPPLEETNDDATTDIGQRAGAAEPGPSSDRGDLGASAEGGPGALPGGTARPHARRPKRHPPAWEQRGLTWTRPRDNDTDGCVAWVMPAGWPERWFGFVSRYPEAGMPVGQYDTAEQSMAAVDAQLRLEGWDT